MWFIPRPPEKKKEKKEEQQNRAARRCWMRIRGKSSKVGQMIAMRKSSERHKKLRNGTALIPQ